MGRIRLSTEKMAHGSNELKITNYGPMGGPAGKPGFKSYQTATRIIYPVGHPNKSKPGKTGKQRRAEKRAEKEKEV